MAGKKGLLLIGDNCCVFVILKESELHHSIGSRIDGAHQVQRPIEIIWAVTVRRP